MKNKTPDLKGGNGKLRKRNADREKQLRDRIVGSIIFFAIIICTIIIIISQNIISNEKMGEADKVKAADYVKEYESETVFKNPETEENCTDNKINFDKPMIALTFDDGPGLRTMEVLDVLEEYGARATFFMCGSSLSRKDIDVAGILKKMDKIGCDTSNHTMSHKQLDTLSKKDIRYEVRGVSKFIQSYIGHGTAALRPPYGSGIHSEKVIKNVELPMIYWSIDTLDWKTKSKKKTIKAVLKNVRDGDIVLMHDIHSWSVDAAVELIPKLIKKGYQLVTVSEMAEARGIKLENGKTYFNFYP